MQILAIFILCGTVLLSYICLGISWHNNNEMEQASVVMVYEGLSPKCS